MMVSLFFFGALLVLLSLPALSDGQVNLEPCHNYSALNNPYRSIGYVATEGVDPMICDLYLISGWYRFISEVGGEMPEFKIDRLHCGTIAPIWLQGSHPTTDEGIVDRTACVNFNNMFDDCLSFNIQVKNCNNSFYAYYLVPPPFGCFTAYCAGTFSSQP